MQEAEPGKQLNPKAEDEPCQESFELSHSRFASLANRAGLPYDVFLTLTVEETITIIKEAAEERDALDKRHDHRAASMMALLANCHRDKKRKAFKPSDFLPQEEETPEQETARVMAEMARLT